MLRLRSSVTTCSALALALFLPAACDGGGGDGGDGDDDTPTVDAAAPVADADPAAPDADPAAPDAGPPPVDAGPTTASLEQVCSLTGFAVAVNAKLGECTGYPELLPTAAQVSAACFGRFQGYFDLGYVNVADDAAFAACAAYLAGVTCTTISADNPCSALVVGQIANGQTCFKDDGFTCRPTSYCGPPDVANFCQTCSAKKANGQVCTASDQCTSAYCTGVCAAAPAFTTLAAGAACDPFDGGTRCPGAQTCRLDDAGTAHVCRLLPTTATDGKKCESLDHVDCAAKHVGLYCNNVAMPGFSPDYRCKPPVALGGACAQGVTHCAEALNQQCVMGMCTQAGAPTPPLAAGATCVPVAGTTPCVFGARCLKNAGAATFTCEYENQQPMCAVR